MLEAIEKQKDEVLKAIPPVMLDIKHLKKVYPTPKGDYTVLDGLNLQVFKEEFISIIGHSGCGKSTLLDTLAGIFFARFNRLIYEIY